MLGRNIAALRNERMLIFASPEALSLMSTELYWAMDGTFASCPKVFKISKSGQIFVIGVVIRHQTIPCVYALITKQNKPTFELVFKKIKEALPSTTTPLSMLCDFDLSAIEGFKKIYPLVEIQGNFNPSKWKKLYQKH